MTGTTKFVLIGGAIALLIIFFGLIKTQINKKNLRAYDLNVECSGVIDSIMVDSLNRGSLKYLVNDQWMYLGSYGRSVRNKIQPGDSITKTKGDSLMMVYRPNELGEYKWLLTVKPWD